MVANSGGTPMSIYLFLRRDSVLNFLANSAWFFFIVNLTKLPFTLGLGLLDIYSFIYILPALPAIALGAFAGKKSRHTHRPKPLPKSHSHLSSSGWNKIDTFVMKASVSTELWLICNSCKRSDVKNLCLALDSLIINLED